MTLLDNSNPELKQPAADAPRATHSESSFARLRRAIDGQEWVKGAVNYDEDLHFSTWYLRASCERQTAGLYAGYSTLLAFYQGFTEHYYLLKQECVATARAIVERALQQPRWLPQIVQRIVELSDKLTRAFPPKTSAARLTRYSDEELLRLYRKHDAAQRALNRYARLPEALDRGVSYFSNYLLEQLRSRGLTHTAADEAFAVLSQPLAPSVLAQELMEFETLVDAARTAGAARLTTAASSSRLRMFLDPSLLKQIRAHHKKWRFLSYHGYGRREPASLGQYIDRLREGLNRPASTTCTCDKHSVAGRERARQAILEELNLDAAHQALFDIYPQIGAAKLHRRNAQLRNFYYLDLLLAEIARRIGVAEWTVRCMTPEEVYESLTSHRRAPSMTAARENGCLFAIVDGTEFVLSGPEFLELQRLVQVKSTVANQSGELRGHVACRGKVSGRCRVVIRADDLREDFEPGSILVSESTDPDLIGILKKAGGVLTEQGGVTSHAAIICRELGIPTIIGIDRLLEHLRDGDLVELDAETGVVRKLSQEIKPLSCVVPGNSGIRPLEQVGGKAHNLDRVHALGFHVPEFFLLNCDDIRNSQPEALAADRAVFEAWTIRQLGLAANETLALRSSAVVEDSDHGSLAGAYRSLLNVEVKKIFPALHEFLASNGSGNGEAGYRGSIIVQRMIEPDYSGVCLTLDSRTGNRNAVILEFVAGGNADVTGGRIQPERVVVDRLTGDILDDERRQTKPASTIDVAALVEQFLTLEARFGKPLDIEWAYTGQKLFILQARAIVHRVLVPLSSSDR